MAEESPIIDLHKHTSLIYGEGIFSKEARKKIPMRCKTADGVLRYAKYPIAGIVDSETKERHRVPVFSSIAEAREKTGADVLILGAAPEGGELPTEWENDILFALTNRMHIVSGMHYSLKDNPRFKEAAEKSGVNIWDVRSIPDTSKISLCSSLAYHVKKPIILTVGSDAAIGKMTVAYEIVRAAQEMGKKTCLIPTGQTAIMIEGWGISIDALPADFMAGAVEKMILEKEKECDVLVVEGQGSLFHPAYANTTISLLHGSVPTHMVLVHRPARKQSIGSNLVKLPGISRIIEQYEKSVLPSYRNARVIGVALSAVDMSDQEYVEEKERIEKETGLLVGDVLREDGFAAKLIHEI